VQHGKANNQNSGGKIGPKTSKDVQGFTNLKYLKKKISTSNIV